MRDINRNIGGYDRPTTESGNTCATPMDATMIALLGGKRVEGVAFSVDQYRALERHYGYDMKKAREGAVAYAEEADKRELEAHEAFMADPDIPSRDKRGKRAPKPSLTSVDQFMVAGAERNMFRAVQEDGMRVMAFIAKYLETGQDPVKMLAQLMLEAGFDMADHAEWAYEDLE